MNKSKNNPFRLVVLFALSCASAAVSAADFQVVGPIEKISNSTATVLGQTFVVSGASSLYSPLVTSVSGVGGGSGVGAYVVVTGVRLNNGTLVAKTIRPLGVAYVPGASQVFIHGTVDRFIGSTGEVQIGSAFIQATEALAQSSSDIRSGSVIELVGTQPVPGGQVLAQSLIAIQGTGAQAIAIQGTGAQAIAIQGTGAQKIAIQGTGAQAIAIQGTGAQAIAIQGTGAQKIAIQGTGAQAIAIQGTGAQAIAIQGTGAQKTAIQGTGAQAIAIQGTGARAIAIQGTGASLN